MNNDTFEGKWTQTKGKLHERWGDLTNDDVERIAGKRASNPILPPQI